MVPGSRFWVKGFGLGVPGSGFRVPGFGFEAWVEGWRFRVVGSGFWVPGSGFDLGVAVVEAVEDVALEQLLVRDPHLHRVVRRAVLLRPGRKRVQGAGLGREVDLGR